MKFENMINQIINGDCYEVIKNIPDKSIDLLITDPPYLHVKGGCKNKKLNVGCRSINSDVVNKMSDFDKKQIYTFLDNVKDKLQKINMYIFCSKLQIPYYLDWALENKLQFDVLFWYKNSNRMISTKFFASNVEYIIRIYDSGCSLNNIQDENGKSKSEMYQKIFLYDTPKNKIHEAQRPIKLFERLILLSSNEKDLILDCFCGSGTTCVACKNTNRRYIGIELNPKWHKIAVDRLNNIQADGQITMFTN